MGLTHIVAQGEHLTKIACAYGFASFRTIWDAPENKALKEDRKNPNVLFPGDRLFIPDKETREESRAVDKRHTFQTDSEKLMLRIKLTDLKNHPLDRHDCTLTIEADTKDFTTKSDGILEREITDPKNTAKGLVLDKGGPETPAAVSTVRQIPLKIGHLDPETKVTGQMARLNNLGYNAGEIPERPPDHPLTDDEQKALGTVPQFKSAVEEFQCDFGLQVDGKCGDKTQKKLLEVHGC